MFAQNSQIGNQSINKCSSCVLGVILPSSVMSHPVLGQVAAGVEEGDLFVGAVSPDGPRGVFRVRDGVVTPFSLGPADRNDSGFFDLPHDVLVDSQGVWCGWRARFRKFRNSRRFVPRIGRGTTPERLAIFRVGNHALDEGYPNPFPDLHSQGMTTDRLSLGSIWRRIGGLRSTMMSTAESPEW